MTGSILNDLQIIELCQGDKPMIIPFEPKQCGKPSYGLGSFGYDLRLGTRFMVHRFGVNTLLDPKKFPTELFTVYETDSHFDIAPHANVLAESVETFDMPPDVTGIAFGKSTYARCGLLCNLTPVEAGWRGKLTLELANLSPLPIRLHVGQGIAQVVFFRGERPKRTYREKEAGCVLFGSDWCYIAAVTEMAKRRGG